MVLPVLHESGFGNQFGMLLEHLSLAQLARAPLQLPPFHQPAEHRSEAEPPPPHPSELLNLSSLNSPCSAVSAISLEQTHLLPQLDSLLTLAVRREDGTEKAPKWHLARLPLRPRSIELAVVRMLQSKGLEHASTFAYCHTIDCRSRTRRACRRTPRLCARTPQRLPNNYLFAHRLSQLLCDRAPSPGLELSRLQLAALQGLKLSESVVADALLLSRELGLFSAIHLRLSDAGALTKGLNRSTLLGQVTALVPTLEKVAAAHTSSSKHHPYSVYLASNRPGEVEALLPTLRGIFGVRFQVYSWKQVAPHVFPLQPIGLRAALIEHELCVRAPIAFAGSVWSTWSNLIGLRRWAQSLSAPRAYLDLATGSAAPPCAEAALPTLLKRGANARRRASRGEGCETWLRELGAIGPTPDVDDNDELP